MAVQVPGALPSYTGYKSYSVLTSDLTLDERRVVRAHVEDVLGYVAKELRIKTDDRDLEIRDILPATDLGLAATNDFLVAGAGIAGTELAYFAPLVGINVCMAFFGVAVENAAPGISSMRLTQGPVAPGVEVRGVYQIESLYDCLEPRAYFTEPVVFTRSETARALVTPRVAFAVNTQRVKLYGKIVEPRGTVLSGSSV